MRRSLLFVLVIAGALVAPAIVASAQDSSGERQGIGIALLEAPENLRDDPRARVDVVDHVNAGTTFERRIEVRNDTAAPADVALYVAPAVIRRGTFDIAPKGAAGELATWASLSPASIALQPNERREVTLRVSVPAGAGDGEYYGAALAAIEAEVDGQVRIGARVGIRMYLSVGDGEAPSSEFEVVGLEASRLDDGRPVVTATVRNTGGRALDLAGELRLEDGPGGVSAGPFSVQVPQTLGIGEEGRVQVELDPETPAGPWLARLAIRSGAVERVVEGEITFPEAGEGPTEVQYDDVTEAKRLPAFIAGALVAAVLLTLFGISQFSRRARIRRKQVTKG